MCYLCLMKKMIFYLFLLMIPAVNNAGIPSYVSAPAAVADIYTVVDLAQSGLARDVFELALKGLLKLETEGNLLNPGIVTIADYSQSSNNKRFYVIDLINRKLLFNTYVAHGRNTGEEYAKYFSNSEGSWKSSLGFYITEEPLTGSHTGYGLQVRGVEKGFNDNARKREIIIHAADYVSESFIRKNGRLGRSFGCPALPPEVNKLIIETIKGGTCLFVYHPDSQYLASSTLLQ